ncbi:hypothetical protein H8B15_20805 [Hymenobacter sp. BT507]|uniref:DUF3408 domain-containing protein n=1 Tax=Hymenobacter citatus TaxID=2763506 RepID=A0ABR7MQL0_9BACT|nr:hypothetical protein [Hymenobacter citatus]MBC6613374.1 hypothetical protein [Hymenobacter citatus]
MAKSFKKAPAAVEPPKRTSEKDIFDFLDEDRKPTTPITTESNTSNIDNTSTVKEDAVTSVTAVTNEEADVRQTFVLGQRYLDKLKDYVHTRRMQGQYEYTQKQALHDALDKLFEGFDITERPAHIRQQEESRKQRIRRGIGK